MKKYSTPAYIDNESEVDARIAELERLRQQRDELLAALRNALPVLEFEVETRGSNDLLYEIPAGPVLDAARAAIAKAQSATGEATPGGAS